MIHKVRFESADGLSKDGKWETVERLPPRIITRACFYVRNQMSDIPAALPTRRYEYYSEDRVDGGQSVHVYRELP